MSFIKHWYIYTNSARSSARKAAKDGSMKG